MKGDVTLKILSAINDFVGDQGDLFDAFLKAGYGASVGKIDYEFKKAQEDRRQDLILKKHRRRYSNLVSRLRRDGLIKEKSVALTGRGLRKLKTLKDRYFNKLPDASSYSKEDGKKYVIIMFDIPEKEKKKREWLRSVLTRLGLKLAQKSVWIGRVKVPQNFLDDLAELKLTEYVEIFEISKTGSLESLI